MEGSTLARLEGRHRGAGGNALRAAVLGSSDGLISNYNLIMGVAGAAMSSSNILLTGLAGLLAGAISMAMGEWIPCRAPGALRKQLATEKEEIERHKEYQAQHLEKSEKELDDLKRKFLEFLRKIGDLTVTGTIQDLNLTDTEEETAGKEWNIDVPKGVDAVHAMTVHKAKGLEFPVVFLVGCAESKFPLQRRGDPLGLPEELVKEELAGGASGHMLEERRLFYVAMTRARDELVLTSASDYGTSRARHV
jgi:superfamily I DNA/RNA helicase